jgi:hypothetical protein
MRGATTRRQAAIGWRAAGAALAIAVAAAPAGAEHTGLGGLRGLLRTTSADVAGRGVLEWGAFASAHTQDDSAGTTRAFLVAPLQVGYGLSRFVEIGVLVPVRAWATPGDNPATGVPAGQAGFGDLELAGKLQFPVPGRVVRLGLLGYAALATGSRSRGFGRLKSDTGLSGALTLDFSWLDRFPAFRAHLNGGYRWVRADSGYGLGGADDPRRGFWPPAASPVPAGGTPDDNDQVNWRAALEFSTRAVTLFTELAYDDTPGLQHTRRRDHPWMLTPGAVVKFRNGINLHAAVDLSLQRDDPPPELPDLPPWQFTLGVTWRHELTFGDRDHDGVRNDRDACPEQAEDFDGFEDEDGCPDADNDGDGVPDRRDLAPDLAEDVDGFEDFDGRPDLDNDGDGLQDADDACPDNGEDFDGDADTDGCPEGAPVPEP